jgi:hypothetical protein
MFNGITSLNKSIIWHKKSLSTEVPIRCHRRNLLIRVTLAIPLAALIIVSCMPSRTASPTPAPQPTETTSPKLTNTSIPRTQVVSFCGSVMARQYLDSIALPVGGIDTVLRNISERPHVQLDTQFIQTQIGILDKTAEQLISTGPATCDLLIEHHVNLLDLVFFLNGVLQAELDGDYEVADQLLDKAMSSVARVGETLQAVITLAEETPAALISPLPLNLVLRDGSELRLIIHQRERSKCVDESPGQYRCNFPLKGTTGDVMLVSTTDGAASDFTALYLDLDKGVQFGEVDRFYALMVEYTITDSSTASAFSSWLSDDLIPSLWNWEATETDAVEFDTHINGVYFRVSATTSILTYKACIGDAAFCVPEGQ